MSFKTTLCLKIIGDQAYELTEPLIYNDGIVELTVHPTFDFDGASVPKALWSFGFSPIPEDKKALYATRNKGFLDAVEAGAITLRGDFEDMDTLMARLMARYSQINEVVRDTYVSELKRVGL